MNSTDYEFDSVESIVQRLRTVRDDDFARNMADALERALADRRAARRQLECRPQAQPVSSGEGAS